MDHIKLVDEHSEQNKMKLHNLAVVFAPNLLNLQSLEDSSLVNGTLPSVFIWFSSLHRYNSVIGVGVTYLPSKQVPRVRFPDDATLFVWVSFLLQ